MITVSVSGSCLSAFGEYPNSDDLDPSVDIDDAPVRVSSWLIAFQFLDGKIKRA